MQVVNVSPDMLRPSSVQLICSPLWVRLGVCGLGAEVDSREAEALAIQSTPLAMLGA